MKFNEKLIELRKQKGLSQEELGFQLNVTRQTISKWELGQTTPEMDKLVEISKIFNVTVDELTKEDTNNEKEKVESKPIKGNDKSKSTTKIIVTIAIIVAILMIIGGLFYGLIFKGILNFGKSINNTQKEIVGGFLNGIQDFANEQMENEGKDDELFNKFSNMTGEMIGAFENNMNEMENDFNQSSKQKNWDREYFISVLEMYAGTEKGSSVKHAIDEIITNNKKDKENIVTITYNGKSTIVEEEQVDIKSNLDNLKDYEVSYNYDDNGNIYEMVIK